MSPTVAADTRRRGKQTAAPGARPSREILHALEVLLAEAPDDTQASPYLAT